MMQKYYYSFKEAVLLVVEVVLLTNNTTCSSRIFLWNHIEIMNSFDRRFTSISTSSWYSSVVVVYVVVAQLLLIVPQNITQIGSLLQSPNDEPNRKLTSSLTVVRHHLMTTNFGTILSNSCVAPSHDGKKDLKKTRIVSNRYKNRRRILCTSKGAAIITVDSQQYRLTHYFSPWTLSPKTSTYAQAHTPA